MVEDDDRPTTAMDAVPPSYEDTTQDTRLGPGTDVGGYVIDGELGKGGMGYVYSATHPVIGKRAAIKVLKPEVSKSPIIVERFIQEARAVNQIHHPNIIDIFAFGALPDGRAYHIMDLLLGEPLRKRLKRGALHPSEAASIIDDIASALTAAHDKGFVHRDLKPDNVFLVEHDGRWPEVKLLDFGLAKLMPERGFSPFTTKPGVMLGTPEYMSPEQARGIGVDYRTDVYALGIVTFECLAGQRPFPSLGDAYATLQSHAEEPPPSLADLVPNLPEELIQLVDAMLAKEPAARPSLAAVRTVIKRLRTTQLPTRTAAGLEIASFQGASNPGVQRPPELGLTASRVGAQPLVPGDLEGPTKPEKRNSQPRVHTQSQPPASGGARGSNPSVPPAAALRSHSQPPVPSQRPSQPRVDSQPVLLQPGSNPPSPYTHGASRDKFIPNVTPAHPSAPGLAGAAPIVSTKLGVPPPPIQVPSPSRPIDVPKVRRGGSRLWLIIGALLAIGAGVALALVLAGD